MPCSKHRAEEVIFTRTLVHRLQMESYGFFHAYKVAKKTNRGVSI